MIFCVLLRVHGLVLPVVLTYCTLRSKTMGYSRHADRGRVNCFHENFRKFYRNPEPGAKIWIDESKIWIDSYLFSPTPLLNNGRFTAVEPRAHHASAKGSLRILRCRQWHNIGAKPQKSTKTYSTGLALAIYNGSVALVLPSQLGPRFPRIQYWLWIPALARKSTMHFEYQRCNPLNLQIKPENHSRSIERSAQTRIVNLGPN